MMIIITFGETLEKLAFPETPIPALSALTEKTNAFHTNRKSYVKPMHKM